MQDKIMMNEKFLKDIDQLSNIVLIEEDKDDGGKKSVARQLTEYFDCDRFMMRGQQIMQSHQKLSDKFNNFIMMFDTLEPFSKISQLSVKEEKLELKQIESWFNQEKDQIRKQCQMNLSETTLKKQKPDLQDVQSQIKKCQDKIKQSWAEINSNCDTIYT